MEGRRRMCRRLDGLSFGFPDAKPANETSWRSLSPCRSVGLSHVTSVYPSTFRAPGGSDKSYREDIYRYS